LDQSFPDPVYGLLFSASVWRKIKPYCLVLNNILV
jgi:hypothetical protein